MGTLFFSVLGSLFLFGALALESLKIGDSIAVNDEPLSSPDKTFSAGFHEVGTNAYCFSVWFNLPSDKKTTVWMANRDRPVPEQGSSLRLARFGALVLFSGNEGKIWDADPNSSLDAVALELLDSGNLVLRNRSGAIVWESFDFPTDTLLPHQKLKRNSMLVSNRANGSYLSGFYTFKFNDDNVLYLTYSGPEYSSVYWPRQDKKIYDQGRTNFNNTRLAMMDEKGFFSSSDSLSFYTSDYGMAPRRRLTLDHDGLLRAYTLNGTTGEWEIVWVPPIRLCEVDGLCGAYGFCLYAPEPTCSCPPRFERKDPADWTQGCVPEFDLSRYTPSEVGFLRFPDADFYGYDLDMYYSTNSTLKNCTELCRNDSRCKGFGFRGKTCFAKFVLLNGRRKPDEKNAIYIKVPAAVAAAEGEELVLNASGLSGEAETIDTSRKKPPRDGPKNIYLRYLIGFVGALGAAEVLALLLGCWFVGRTNLGPLERGYRLQKMVGFRRFTYKELKKATANFKEEIGRGGFGPVYRGVTEDGRTAIAVKKLDCMVFRGETEFWAEVSVIGRLNHVNLVRVCGFCAEKKHRLVVYQYLEKGSLDKHLFFAEGGEVLSWMQRYAIAVETAMGLAYLHEECLEWVLHCDVKPQNILLDDNFRPKLADFGMSKLAGEERGNLQVSGVRGTRGYMAPEWMANHEVTAKVDVYSYGVVLLELVTGRSAWSVHGDSNQMLPRWVQDKVKRGNNLVEELVDPKLNGNYERAQVELVIRVALLCVKGSKDHRPAMSAVVKLLRGDNEDNEYSSFSQRSKLQLTSVDMNEVT